MTVKFLIGFLVAGLQLTSAEKILIWVNSPSDLKYYKEMVKVYQKKVDPKFEAEILSYGFTDLPNKLSLAIKTGVNPPDIVQLDELHFSIYLGAKEVPFVDLSKRAFESGIVQSISPQRIGLFQYKDKLYGIPQSLSAVVLYYRSDMFEKLEIEPSALSTWDKFMEIGLKIKQERRALLAMDWSYIEMLVRQRGSDLFKADGSHNLDDPLVIETIEFLVKMVKDGVGEVPDRGTLYDPTFFSGDVAHGEILSVIGAGWYGLDMIGQFTPPELKGTWSFVPLPSWNDSKSKSKRRTSTFSGQGLLIYKGSKKIETAWQFMKWVMTDIDANVERYLQGNAFPCFIPSWVDGRLNRKDSVFNNKSLGAMMVNLAHDIPPHIQSPNRIKLIGLLRERYWHDLLAGTRPVKEILADIKKELAKK